MSNPWKVFESLLPDTPMDVGQVLSHAAGNSRVQLPTGDIITARGTSVAAGSMAYIRSGEVVGEAPGLVAIEVEV
jgi:hypothetical protein